MKNRSFRKPPLPARWLLSLMSVYQSDFLSEGDFNEYYFNILGSEGRTKALRWYWSQVILSLPTYIVLIIKWRIAMLKNAFKITFRLIKRHKGFSFINIAGLSVGIACSILVLLYVCDELSFDRFHEKADRIYRITADASGRSDFRIHQLGTPAILSRTLLDKYPKVEEVTRLTDLDQTIVQTEKRSFKENRVFAAEPSFFRIFSFPLLEGSPDTALAEPNKVVITQSAARKYFGNSDPMNRRIQMDLDGDVVACIVSGVAEDVPQNSHFRFDFLISLETFEWIRPTGNHLRDWFRNNHITYLLLCEGAGQAEVENNLAEILDTYAFAGEAHSWKWTLTPLAGIHLQSDLRTGLEPNGSATYVVIFAVIAFLILLIACINFTNLSTARSARRAKEVAIRKVVGSERKQLIKQFLGESILFSFLSLILALVLIHIFLPHYQTLIGRSLAIPLFSNIRILLGLMGGAVLVGLISGFYPSFFLSSFSPMHVLRAPLLKGRQSRAPRLRSGLVIFQFSMSILLIIGIITIFKQIDYIRNARLGFDKEYVVIVHNADKLGEGSQVLKDKLRQVSGIEQVSSARYIPGTRFTNIGISIPGVDGSALNMTLDICSCDQNFRDTLRMEMAEGRFFRTDFPADRSAIVINEETVRYFRLEDPLGKSIIFPYAEKEYVIIGILRDIHYEPLHNMVNRMGLILPGSFFPDHDRYIFGRIRLDDVPGTLDSIKKTWRALSPGIPFEFSFLDENLDRAYSNEIRTGKIVGVFSSLAVLISCLGIFGLAAFMAEQRTKEIGIRKVMGAKLSDIILLLSRETMKWVLISNVIVWPLGFLIMGRWLQNFAYRVDMGMGVFLLAGGIALGTALLTISFLLLKAARSNPIDSLRYE
jgi:putative ABC transport system permease protein